MITEEDKIKTFSKYVYKKELSNSYQLIKDNERKNNDLLSNKLKEIGDESLKLKDRMDKKIFTDTQRIISHARLESREKILGLKKELLDNLKLEITNSLREFTNTPAYKEYFSNLLSKIKDLLPPNEGLKIYLVEKDLPLFQDQIKSVCENPEILKMNDENIGGLIIESDKLNERLDFSIKRKIQGLGNEIGIELYEVLEK